MEASSPTVRRPLRSTIVTPSRSLCTISRLMRVCRFQAFDCIRSGKEKLDRHLDADFGFHIFDRHHLDGVPRAPIEECAIRSLADTFLAADAQERVLRFVRTADDPGLGSSTCNRPPG